MTDTTMTTITRKIGRRTFTVEVPAVAGPNGASGVRLQDAQRADLAIAAALAVDGPVSSEGFIFMRKAIRLAAKDLAPLLAVTPVTVSRWENGAADVDRNAWVTLGTMVLEEAGRPSVVRERLERLASGHKPPREMRVEL